MKTRWTWRDVAADTVVVSAEPVTAPKSERGEWVEVTLEDGRVVEIPASLVTVHE